MVPFPFESGEGSWSRSWPVAHQTVPSTNPLFSNDLLTIQLSVLLAILPRPQPQGIKNANGHSHAG